MKLSALHCMLMVMNKKQQLFAFSCEIGVWEEMGSDDQNKKYHCRVCLWGRTSKSYVDETNSSMRYLLNLKHWDQKWRDVERQALCIWFSTSCVSLGVSQWGRVTNNRKLWLFKRGNTVMWSWWQVLSSSALPWVQRIQYIKHSIVQHDVGPHCPSTCS